MVACYLGVVEVAGSNPVVPIFLLPIKMRGMLLMRKIKILIYILPSALLLIFGIYLFLLFGLPEILNSKQFIQKAEDFIYQKTNLQISIENSGIINKRFL